MCFEFLLPISYITSYFSLNLGVLLQYLLDFSLQSMH